MPRASTTLRKSSIRFSAHGEDRVPDGKRRCEPSFLIVLVASKSRATLPTRCRRPVSIPSRLCRHHQKRLRPESEAQSQAPQAQAIGNETSHQDAFARLIYLQAWVWGRGGEVRLVVVQGRCAGPPAARPLDSDPHQPAVSDEFRRLS